MPSGFQQDLNQLQPTFYRVTIDTSGYPTTGTTGGGVTPNSVDSFDKADFPTTTALSQNRSRGNMRFENIVRRLSGLTDCQIIDVTITEADADTQATAIAFTVKFERDDFIQTGGTAVDGATAITTKVLKIRDEVARGIRDEVTMSARVYTPEDDADRQERLSITAPVAAGAAWADVGVSLIDETTLLD
jgi:hypothetical protein